MKPVAVVFAIVVTASMAALSHAINDGLCRLDNKTMTCLPSSLCTVKNRTQTKPCNLRSHARMLPQQIHLAYAGIPTGTGMTISWATFDNVQDSAVWIGSSPATLKQRTDVSVSSFTYYSEGDYSLYQHHARVTGLRPDTKYYYKVGKASDPYFTSAVSTFTTARPSSDSRPFDVIVYGDLGFLAKGEATQAYVNSIYDKNTFVLHIGDISYADDDNLSDEFSGKFGYEIVWNRWMNAFAPTMGHIPYMVCVGNHEAECHSRQCFQSRYKQQHLGNYTAYNARFRMPSFESNGTQDMWYSFDNGPIHITAISSETDYDGFPQNDYDYEIFGGFYKSYGNFGNQLAWLEADLKKAVANRANVPWIIVVMHRPIYQKGGVLPNGTLTDYSLPLQKAFEPLFLNYNVDLVYARHEHEFERQTQKFAPHHASKFSTNRRRPEQAPVIVRGLSQPLNSDQGHTSPLRRVTNPGSRFLKSGFSDHGNLATLTTRSMDDELVSETLSALLNLTPTENSGAERVTAATAISHLLSTRSVSERRARLIVGEGKCDECYCTLGQLVQQDDCECPCHCQCCCPPAFHCLKDCVCACKCHYEAASDEEVESGPETQVDLGQVELDSSNDERAERPDISSGDESDEGTSTIEKETTVMDPQSTVEEDEEMDENPLPVPAALEDLSNGDLLDWLEKCLDADGVQAADQARQVLRGLFTRLYNNLASSGPELKNEGNKHLPNLKAGDDDFLFEYIAALRQYLRYHPSRILAAVKDVALAGRRSNWDFERVLRIRATSAKTPRDPPTNGWQTGTATAPSLPRPPAIPAFRFDPAVYSPEESERFKAVCEQEHAFATTTRTPSDDEWTVIMGLMAGTIIAGAMPQFVKRCCTISQMVWIHDQIVKKAEGELWAPLPRGSKVYNFNQTTRRLVEELRQGVAHQRWTDPQFERMLTLVKTVVYNPDLHALHFFFFTKFDPIQFEGMEIPFRSSRLTLRNPDTKLRRSENNHGLPTDEDDGLENDRYQAHYKFRLVNVPRTFDLMAVIAHLQERTGNSLKSAVPLDTYGPYAEGSVMWDVYAKTAKCPNELVDIHRINWDGHVIMVQHRPSEGLQPCMQCARVGHKTTACPTPKEEWDATTITVSATQITTTCVTRPGWKNLDDVKHIFTTLRDANGGVTTNTREQRGDLPANDGDVQTNGADTVNVQRTKETEERPEEAKTSKTQMDQAEGEHDASAPLRTKDNNVFMPVVSKRQRRKKKHSNAGVQGATTTSTHKDQHSAQDTKLETSSNRYIDLTKDDGSEDESDSDDSPEAEEAGQSQPNTEEATATTPTETMTDHEVLDAAINQAKMERARETLRVQVQTRTEPVDLAGITAAIDRARPHLTSKASDAWVLEAIGGRLTDTPATGNCQYYAVIESLMH